MQEKKTTEVSMKAMLRKLPDAGMVVLLFALPVLLPAGVV
jgi:hypothetical protein